MEVQEVVPKKYSGNILQLVRHDDPILKTRLVDFDFQNPATDPIQLAHDLSTTVIAKVGLGLSANQVGLPHRAFVMIGEPMLVCFNPRIVNFFEEEIKLEEGCLSYPGIFLPIKRPKMVRVRFQMPNGAVITKQFDGMSSRIFQHELDHLNGVDFISRAHTYYREKARKKMRKKMRSL